MTASPSLRLVPPELALNDENELAALRRGDPQALERCYRAHSARLRATVLRLTASVEDAEDVVHELFLHLPETVQQYVDRGQWSGWLTTVAIRRALAHERRERGRRHEALHADGDHAAPTVDGDPVAGQRVMQALQRLSAPLRHVFVLRSVHDYTHPEIAAALNISINTSEVRMHRAVQQLRTLLGDLR